MKIRTARRISQVFFFSLFLFFVVISDLRYLKGYPVSLFLELDPLVAFATAITTHTIYKGLLWSLVLLIPTILAARWISVALPIVCLRWSNSFPRGILAILTWGGLRGSLSVAMVLSLPKFPLRDLLVGCTYLVMLFSVLVQGTTMRRLLTFYGIGTGEDHAPKKS